MRIAKNFDEAVSILLDILNDKQKEDFKKMDLTSFKAAMHFTVGMEIRNYWKLWQGNDLTKWFNKNGIFHADDMSGLILQALYSKIKNDEFNFKAAAARYWQYWINFENNMLLLNDISKRTIEYLINEQSQKENNEQS